MKVDPVFVAGAIAFAIGVFMFARWRSPRPEFPPLQTKPDDPLLLKATTDAQSSCSEFVRLARARPETAALKLRFVTNTEHVEHVWAEVLEVVSDEELRVRLITPPVTHRGELDRVYTCKLSEIEDWQARDAQDKLRGGFTQRAMYAIARRDGVKLPKKLLELENDYADR